MATLDLAPRPCEYFALCTNEATGTVPNPIIGPVPCCDRCADRVGLTVTTWARHQSWRDYAERMKQVARNEAAYRAGRAAERRAVIGGA